MSKFASFKSAKHGEYLYAGNPMFNSDRRHVLTWGGKATPDEDPDMQWEVVDFGDFVGIKSIKHDEWMYAGSPHLDKDRRHVLTWKKAGDPKSDPDMRWKIVNFGDFVGIKSVKHDEWMYAGNPHLDNGRRHVLTYEKSGDPKSDPDMRWIMDHHWLHGKPTAVFSIGWQQIGTLPAGRTTSTVIKVGVTQKDSKKETNSTSFTNTFEVSASYTFPVGATAEAKNSTALALSQIVETMSSTTITYQEEYEENWEVSDKDQKVWGLTMEGVLLAHSPTCGFKHSPYTLFPRICRREWVQIRQQEVRSDW